MAWGNGLAALGVAIEIIGFVILAVELRGANTSALSEVKTLGEMPRDAKTIIVSDGPDGGIDMTGERIGAFLANFNRRQADLTRSKRLIFHGLVWAAGGLVVQLIGSLFQIFNL